MLILNIFGVHYVQNVVFSIEKGSDVQNHTFSDCHCPIKKNPASKFPIFETHFVRQDLHS